jgi:integrase
VEKHDRGHKRTFEDKKGEHKSEHTSRTHARSKANLGYWENAIFQRRPGGNWWVQIQYGGRREKFSLRTPIKSAAAARARDAYQTLVVKGWDEVLGQWKPQSAPPGDASTIGDFLEELKARADLKPKTLEGYAVALRKIVADAFGIDGGRDKYDYRSGGYQRWLERVHAVELAALTPEVVQQWKRLFLSRAGDDPIRSRAAKISVNSFLRRAKSLFAARAVKHLSRVQLPSPLPFGKVSFEPRQSMRYRSTINVEALTRAAHEELAQADAPVFLAFLLALGAGLRRIEIDRLEWSAFRWNENVIRIEPTQHFDVKTEHSIGDVPVDPELMSIMRGYAAKARSNFVIASPNLPRARATFENYRAQNAFERLSAWLRSKGVQAQKPIHELRKESGSMVNRKHGLTAAKDFLRHADIAITAAHYIDRPRQATSGLGALLKAAQDEKIIPLEEVTHEHVGETDAFSRISVLPHLQKRRKT